MERLRTRLSVLRSKNPNAFTLIELIVVIVIIGILAAVAAVAYNSFIAGADLSAKESTSVQTAKLIQSQSALDQSIACSMDAARSPSGSQADFTDLSFSSDIPTDVTTLNMTACNLSVVFDDGTVCSGVTFPTNTPGASYTGTWTCGDLTLPTGSASVLTTAGNGTLLVSWTDPADTGGSAVIEYTATTSPGGATCTAPAPDTSCTITGLQNGVSYTTTVTARTVAGTGEVSSSSNPATPVGSPDAPAAAVLTAIPAGLTVSWSAPASDGGSPVTSYTATTNSGESCTATAPATSCDITGLDYTLSYTVTVTATNIGGTSQASSQSASLNPGPPFNSATCTGCTTTEVVDYNGTGETWRVHTFTSSGSLDVLDSQQPFRVLVVASGNGGQPMDGGMNGNGGAGGGVQDVSRNLTPSSIPVVVAPSVGLNSGGSASSFTDVVAAPAAGAGGGAGNPQPFNWIQGSGGGTGPASDITGTTQYYGSGGGGGGGAGAPQSPNGAGTYGRGGHGGHWSDNPTRGQGGAQGIVIVSYQIG